MVRNKYLLIFTSLLLFSAMALADTKCFYLEQEELVEGRETEREELTEGAEGKDWIRLLLSGEYGVIRQPTFLFDRKHDRFILRAGSPESIAAYKEIPLFLKYCSLKIPFS